MKRHDDTPARRRFRCVRAAVLAISPLVVNSGCGREMLRGSTAAPVPPMIGAASREGAEYGSTVAELLPATYRSQLAYDPTKRLGGLPTALWYTPARGLDSLLTACETTRIPPPLVRSAPSAREASRQVAVAAPTAIARPQRQLDPLLVASEATRIPLPRPRPAVAGGDSLAALANQAGPSREPDTLASALQATRIAPPIPPRPARRDGSGDLRSAFAATGIAPPIPLRPSRDDGGVQRTNFDTAAAAAMLDAPNAMPLEPPQTASNATQGPPGALPMTPAPEPSAPVPPPIKAPQPLPAAVSSRGETVDLDNLSLVSACEATKIAPPVSPAETVTPTPRVSGIPVYRAAGPEADRSQGR